MENIWTKEELSGNGEHNSPTFFRYLNKSGYSGLCINADGGNSKYVQNFLMETC